MTKHPLDDELSNTFLWHALIALFGERPVTLLMKSAIRATYEAGYRDALEQTRLTSFDQAAAAIDGMVLNFFVTCPLDIVDPATTEH